MIRNTALFGFPVLRMRIDPKSYKKKSIISTIEKNFRLNRKRNQWDRSSVLHHAYGDFSNPKYHKVNFNSLTPVYRTALISLFNSMGLFSAYHFDFLLVNYTCLSSTNYMSSHVHPGADFTAVHYIQFDKKHHSPTIFENALPHTEYIDQLRPQLTKILSAKHDSNSWAYRYWALNTEEDDFCLSPAFLRHKIDPQISKNKNRITLVLNISLSKQVDFNKTSRQQ
jgi:hypothetical protein